MKSVNLSMHAGIGQYPVQDFCSNLILCVLRGQPALQRRWLPAACLDAASCRTVQRRGRARPWGGRQRENPGSLSSSRQPPASPQSLASVSEMPAPPRPPPPPDPEAVKRVKFLELAPPPPAAADDLEEDAPPPPTSIAPAAASKGSGASASGSQAPFVGVTGSGLEIKNA